MYQGKRKDQIEFSEKACFIAALGLVAIIMLHVVYRVL